MNGKTPMAWQGQRSEITTRGSALSTLPRYGRRVTYGGQLCGVIDGDVFSRRYDSARHVLRRLQALALAVEVLEQLDGVHAICMIDEDGAEHWLTLEEFNRYGISLNDPRYGAQIAVPLRYWRPTRENSAPLEIEDDRPPRWAQGTLL